MAKAKQASLVDFLEAYKELETAIRGCTHGLDLSWCETNDANLPDTVLSLEDSVTDKKVWNSLRLCRNIRNYAQHNENAEGFVLVSQEMIQFLRGLTRDILAIDGIVKDEMKKCSIKITEKNTISEAAAAMAKAGTGWYPITNDNGMCCNIIDKSRLFDCLAAGLTPKTKIGKILDDNATEFALIIQTTPTSGLAGIQADKIVVTTQTGKAVGIIEK